MEKPLDKVIRLANVLIPKDHVNKGLLHLFFSMVIAYMSFFVGTVLAIVLVICAIINSVYGQLLIFRADSTQSE